MAVTMKNSIDEELAGKHIFVTGGTGFMGKVLLEKLLRSCPTLGRIYVLLRPKRGASIQKRLQAIIDTPLFEPLLKVRPEALSQLHVVAGDCSKLGLGLSPEDKTLLVDNVSYVFHAAATVRFDDPLQSAILLNTRGTQEVVELCKKMKQLKALQYVSTTYCFTNEPVLKEKPYRTDIDWRTMIKIAEREDGYTLAAMTHKILGFQPNTYTFSKALAENIINDARNDIPAVIFRPAVVISSMSEPFPGWLDNLNGPFGIWAAALKGVLRYSYGNADVALSFTPVDWAIRGMIVCAICKGIQSPGLGTKPEEVDVVNMEGSSYERNTFRQQMSSFDTWKPRAMLPIRYPRYIITPCYTYYWLGTVLSQLPYGLVIDILLKLSGQKPRMLSAYRKIFHANEALSYFMLYEFPIETGKSDVLHHCLQTKDRLYFGTYLREDETDMSYELEELKDYVIEGIFKYVFKEEASFESRARRIKMLHALEIVLNIIWCYCMYMTVGKFVISRLPFLS